MLNDLSLEETQGNESLDITLENLSINAERVVAEDSLLEHVYQRCGHLLLMMMCVKFKVVKIIIKI